MARLSSTGRNHEADTFFPLLRQVGEGIGVKIDACELIVRPGGILLPYGTSCEGTSFDFHFVITNGSWTESEWHGAQLALQGQARELLAEVREMIATESRGKTCRYVMRMSTQVSNQIELALAVVDSEQPVVLGKCGTYMFLHMLGLYPFDGAQPLDLAKEAGSVAEFLTKRTLVRGRRGPLIQLRPSGRMSAFADGRSAAPR